MFNVIKIATISSAALTLALAFTPSASAQIGSVTGGLNTTVNQGLTPATDLRAGTRISNSTSVAVPSRARIGVDAPDVSVKAPARASVGHAPAHGHYHGHHYHGGFHHEHGDYGYGHFHNNDHSYKHGYASVSVTIDASAEPEPVAPLLVYGTKVESRKGKDLGRITAIARTQTGLISSVMVDGVPGTIPVSTLSAESGVLVTSMSKKKLKR